MDVQKAEQPLASDAGFALPVAIGMGLIMLLLGVTMIVRSHDDRINATSQRSTSQSLAAAEAGVNKLRAFLDRYRILAAYPSTGADSWANPGTILDSLLYANCATTVGDMEPARDQHYPSGTNWPDVVAGDPTQGEYRLVEYDYIGMPGDPGSLGRLIVQGRANVGQPNEAVSQIQVEIPVEVRQGEIPGIWVPETGTVQNAPRVKSMVLGGCGATLNVSAEPEAIVTQSAIDMPPLPVRPTTNVVALTTMPAEDLPRSADTPVGGIYHYSIPQLNESFTVVPNGNKVYVWVEGDINLADKVVRQSCSGTPGCSTTNVRIIGTNLSGNSIVLNEGSVVCDVLFHAPAYTVNFNAGGSAVNDCGNIAVTGPSLETNSAYWVQDWTGATGSVTLVAPTASWLDVEGISLLPQLSPVSRWETQEVVN